MSLRREQPKYSFIFSSCALLQYLSSSVLCFLRQGAVCILSPTHYHFKNAIGGTKSDIKEIASWISWGFLSFHSSALLWSWWRSELWCIHMTPMMLMNQSLLKRSQKEKMKQSHLYWEKPSPQIAADLYFIQLCLLILQILRALHILLASSLTSACFFRILQPTENSIGSEYINWCK